MQESQIRKSKLESVKLKLTLGQFEIDGRKDVLLRSHGGVGFHLGKYRRCLGGWHQDHGVLVHLVLRSERSSWLFRV